MKKLKPWIKIGNKRKWLKYLLRGIGAGIANVVVGIPVWAVYLIATLLLGTIPVIGSWLVVGMTLLSIPFAFIVSGWIITKITELIQ